jgi:hypothetical protein
MLCIQVDENQHKGYDIINETIRYNDLMMIHGGKFIFIRFNPDPYKDKNKRRRNPLITIRYQMLKEKIEKQIEIHHMYYNEV